MFCDKCQTRCDYCQDCAKQDVAEARKKAADKVRVFARQRASPDSYLWGPLTELADQIQWGEV